VDAVELLERLAERGVELAAEGDRLRYRPREAVPPDLRAALAAHKPEILRLFSAEGDEVAWRAEAMRRQVPPRGAIPWLMAREEARTSPRGTCLSCGDALAAGRRFRCGPCVRAVELVLNEVREGLGRATT
jgi:hypothetical protein